MAVVQARSGQPAVYNATLPTISDGTPCALQVDSRGRLITTLALNDYTDDSAFTPGTDMVLALGAMADDTSPDSVDEGDIGIPRMSLRRELYFQIRDAAGNERGANVDASGQLGVVEANSSAMLTALQTISGWDETNRAAVNLISGQAGVAGGSGVDAANVLRVSLATDVGLPAGTQNIGDVDVASLPAANLGQQASAASLSVTPATDIADATYIGDIKFGESLPAGTATIGKVSQDETITESTTSQDLSAAALNYTTSISADFRLNYITIHFSGAVSETVTITIDALAGANYDTVLVSQTLTSETDFIYALDAPLDFKSGNEIKVECTNAGGANTAYVVISTEAR